MYKSVSVNSVGDGSEVLSRNISTKFAEIAGQEVNGFKLIDVKVTSVYKPNSNIIVHTAIIIYETDTGVITI